MMGSKGQEVEALAASIDEKMKLAGEIAVEDLTDTEASLLKDKEFLKNLESSCKMKTKEWEERSKTRACWNRHRSFLRAGGVWYCSRLLGTFFLLCWALAFDPSTHPLSGSTQENAA